PACRRGRVEEQPVAICRLKRVAADYKADIRHRLPAIPSEKNGKRAALVGAGPASLTVARDLLPLGYQVVVYDGDPRAGGVVRSGFEEMKASPWEKEDAMHEGIPIINYHVPREVVLEHGKLVGMRFDKVKAEYDAKGRRTLVPTGEEPVFMPCDDVLVAIGQENAFPWIERDSGIAFDRAGLP